MNSHFFGKRVLVTGGAGFIGSHLCERLLTSGSAITVVDPAVKRTQPSNLAALKGGADIIAGDLGDLIRNDQLKPAGFDYVFHLAGNSSVPVSVANPVEDFYINAQNTVTLLNALRLGGSEAVVVNVSSGLVYGKPESGKLTEHSETRPISPYGASKLTAERYAAVFAEMYGIKTISVRFFAIYGPRQRKQVVYDLFAKLAASPTRIEVIGDGTQLRDFLYVDDAVEALLAVAERSPLNGDVYNVATGSGITIDQLVRAIAREMGLNPDIVYTGSVRPGDDQGWSVDTSKVRTELGFEPQVSLEEGLRRLRRWFESDVVARSGLADFS